MDNPGRGLVPEEYRAGVAAADDKLAVWSVKVDSLDGLAIAVAFVLLNGLRGGLVVDGVFEEENIVVIVAGQNFYDEKKEHETKEKFILTRTTFTQILITQTKKPANQ